ncbi:hypothetical protein MRY87_04250 [bacterium]|nr:hypothetical protein [bacterium]
MNRCYIPHNQEGPVVLSINGHDLVFIGCDPEVFEESDVLSRSESKLDLQEYDIDDYEIQALPEDNAELSFESSTDFADLERERLLQLLKEKGVLGGDSGIPDNAAHGEAAHGEERRSDEEDLSSENELLDEDLAEDEFDEEFDEEFELDDDPSFEELVSSDEAVLSQQVELFARDIARKAGSGVVFVPPQISLDELIETLEQELPWCH